jgi:hypothetical protein
MNARFLHPSARNNNAAAHVTTGTAATPAAAPAEPADCCPAKAVVRVIMARQQADQRLCGHHYRASRHTLASAAAAVRALPGTPADITAWLQLGHDARPVAAC